jgi:hypothetical protein
MVVLLSSSMVFAQDICESDFTCDGDVDSADVSTFLEDFGRSQFFNPCQPCVPLSPVPKTDKTSCYDENGNSRDCTGTGEDGEYQLGYERFTDNGDGTVTDTFTGLMWQRDADCMVTHYPSFDNDSTAGNGEVTWQHALDFVQGINDGAYPLCGGGYNDWRLPSVYDLKSFSTYPPVGQPFINLAFDHYWTSTTYEYDASRAHVVKTDNASMTNHPKINFLPVWCVRGGH